jgi:dTDP-4-dehydrorhamnose reductase
MKTLVTGAEGQLGRDCLAVLAARHDVRGVDLPDTDITSAASVEAVFTEFEPECVVNCAGYTDVDGCETNRRAAWRANVDGPCLLARHAERRGCRLIHISTDYVFAGDRKPPRPYFEEDRPDPATYYGITKLEGERAVAAATPRHVIVRTAWLYGAGGRNFLKAILGRALKPGSRPLRVVNDQYGSPTWSYRLATQLACLVDIDHAGVYHASAEGVCTWYELAVRFLEHMDIDCPVEPCTTDEFPRPAKRPANSILENLRLREEGLNRMVPWEEDLARFVAECGDRLLKEAQR